MKRKPTKRFPYGYGRGEDAAGTVIVFSIFLTGCFALYESLERLHSQHTIENVPLVMVGVWLGYPLMDPDISVKEAHAISMKARHQILHHVPALSDAVIHVDPVDASGERYHTRCERSPKD